MATPRSFLRVQLGGVLLALGLLAPAFTSTALAAPPSPATTGSQTTIEPVIDSDFADPDILLVDGVYHAYATNTTTQNVQHQTSTDLVTWTPQGDVLPTLGDWVGPCETRTDGTFGYCVWAPEVAAVAGGYALYYTAQDELGRDPRQCIGVALSDSPDGPFLPVGSEPLVCPDGERGTTDLGGAIDAATYVEDGQLYLLWKSDGNCCVGTVPAPAIYLQPLSADGTTLTGPPVELIRLDQPFEGRVVEAPTLIKRDGTYYLFYSANDYYGGGYRTAYATSSSLTGPYTKATTELMTTDLFQGDVIGPGGQDIIQNADGTMSIVFHGWDPTYSYRGIYLSDLEWSASGVPSVEAAATRYQAEDGVIRDARVVADPTASGGEKVGGLDLPTSSVTLQIYADRAGPATLGIRYSNGSTNDSGPLLATDSLTVNGRAAGTVTFAHTTWGNWQLVEHQVVLKKGLNTVTLTKLTNFAEIDSVDVYEGQPSATPSGPPASPATATRIEVENGIITNARIRQERTASGGAVVGGLDFADSSVTLQVCVAKAGPTTLGIRYSNGSDRGGYPVEATHDVTVNGRDAGTVTFAHTRWGNWTTVEHRVLLQKGCNTVTFTRASFFVELDAVDVY